MSGENRFPVTKNEAVIIARALNTVTVQGIETQKQVTSLFDKLAAFVEQEERPTNGDELQTVTE